MLFRSLPLLSPRVFFSPLHPTSRIDILDLENLDLIRRSSRARYPRSPPCFFRIDSVYISRIFEPKNRHHLGFHCIPQYMYYTTVGSFQGVKMLANQAECSYVMGFIVVDEIRNPRFRV